MRINWVNQLNTSHLNFSHHIISTQQMVASMLPAETSLLWLPLIKLYYSRMQISESEKRKQVFIHLRKLKSYQILFVCLFSCPQRNYIKEVFMLISSGTKIFSVWEKRNKCKFNNIRLYITIFGLSVISLNIVFLSRLFFFFFLASPTRRA